jgi:ribosomal protein L37AE/L43A
MDTLDLLKKVKKEEDFYWNELNYRTHELDFFKERLDETPGDSSICELYELNRRATVLLAKKHQEMLQQKKELFNGMSEVELYYCPNCDSMTKTFNVSGTYKWICGKCCSDKSEAYLNQKQLEEKKQ